MNIFIFLSLKSDGWPIWTNRLPHLNLSVFQLTFDYAYFPVKCA